MQVLGKFGGFFFTFMYLAERKKKKERKRVYLLTCLYATRYLEKDALRIYIEYVGIRPRA